MSRTGGNPELKKHQFTCEGEPNNAQLRLWVQPSLLKRLNETKGDKRNQFIRETLIKALESEAEAENE
ncbi:MULTISPECIES: hypothetical protein [unclassified Dolichospermum]|jgi:hypothetical protein|uniref:hypothetical protein n=1 Tax=unclassified Dolichospermum TaxID=2622029 RepID=UPI0014464CAF|nr:MULTISPECIES: hypothetical protein [unclassified Dolichospermum]MTJ15513.1 hypothetical protein [Dolichospermum sp. UHCC 0299]MTJ41348.1 hypothetical protein [Dolichospermum sp. UHCC 0406]